MSGSLLCVVPVLAYETSRRCLASILAEDSAAGFARDEILVVDNSREGWGRVLLADLGASDVECYRDPDGHNLGWARSFNVGARRVLAEGRDYVALCSASMEFGPIMHCTWRWQLEQCWGERVIEIDGHSWHGITFHREVLERVGLMDENYYPAYVEGLDYSYRMRQVGWESGWRHVWVNVVSHAVAGHLRYVDCPGGLLDLYYAQKFGGPKHHEQWTQPFGDKPLDYWPERSIPELAKRYGLGQRYERWW